MPAEGGEAKRLTFNSTREVPTNFTADDVAERARKLAVLTASLGRDEVRKLLAPGAPDPQAVPSHARSCAELRAERHRNAQWVPDRFGGAR